MAVDVRCEWCSKKQSIRRSRLPKYRFCSITCRNKWRAKNWTQARNPKWIGGVRKKRCRQCHEWFEKPPRQAQCVFVRRKFCSPECVRLGQRRLHGSLHPNFKGPYSRRRRNHNQSAWVSAILKRSGGECEKCGARGHLHAHHIKPVETHPELRLDRGNGIALCHLCHWEIHNGALPAKGVNSGKLRAIHAWGRGQSRAKQRMKVR